MLALLPFATPGGGEAEALVAQGLLEDIAAELTRFPLLQVISWMSGLAVADLPDAEAGTRLGASHVLRGGLRRRGERLRITATLVETAGARQIWSDAFEAPAEGIFEVQDEIVARTAAILVARLEDRALADARRKPAESLAAWEVTLRGLQLLREGSLAADEEARGYFERAIAIDPHYARAHAGLSLSHFNEWSCQHWDLFEGNGAQAYAHAHAALALDDRDPMVHVVIGRVLLYRRQFDQAAWYFDRALALCPNDAEAADPAGALRRLPWPAGAGAGEGREGDAPEPLSPRPLLSDRRARAFLLARFRDGDLGRGAHHRGPVHRHAGLHCHGARLHRTPG